MLNQLARHRWVCFVQGGLAFTLGLWLLYVRDLVASDMTGTLAFALVLLATGFVLVAAGLLDMAVALDMTFHAVATSRNRAAAGVLIPPSPRSPFGHWLAGADKPALRDAGLWWTMGCIALAVGVAVVAAPTLSLRILAAFAALHAVLIAAMDLSFLPSLVHHRGAQTICITSSLVYLLCSFALAFGAFSSDAQATRSLGAYAAYFGLRMVFLGHHLRPDHHLPFAVSS
jgi:hypothetical protein